MQSFFSICYRRVIPGRYKGQGIIQRFTAVYNPFAYFSSEGTTAQRAVPRLRRGHGIRRGRPLGAISSDEESQSTAGANDSDRHKFSNELQKDSDGSVSSNRILEGKESSETRQWNRDIASYNTRHASKRSIISQLLNSPEERHQPSDAEFLSKTVDSRDEQRNANVERDQTRHAYRPNIDPEETSILLFPGQGSHFVGMGAKLLDYPKVSDMFKVANRILGFDLLEMCLRGPKDVLNKTVHSQPAVLVTSLAAVEKLKHDNPQAIENCVSAAGYDVGEYSALVFSGALSFEDAVILVKSRAKSMQSASGLIPSGMMMVFYGASNRINFACHAAKLYCSKELGMADTVCDVTSFLHPGCKVISGNQEALDFIAKNRQHFGIDRVQRLPVAGAFNCRLMHAATTPLVRALASVQLNLPIIPVHSNVTARRFRSTSSISKLLVEQLCKPIRWEQTMHVLYGRTVGAAFPRTFEVGPGRQMGSILRMINAKAFAQYETVEV